MLQLSDETRIKLNEDIDSATHGLRDKFNELLRMGSEMSLSVYLNCLSSSLLTTGLSSGSSIALSLIIENIKAYLTATADVISGQNQLAREESQLQSLQQARAAQQQAVVIDCGRLGLDVTSGIDVISDRLIRQYTALNTNNEELRRQLANVAWQIGLSFVSSLVLGITVCFIGATYGTMVPIISGTIASLFAVVSIWRAVSYNRTQAIVEQNQQAAAQYLRSREYITVTIPQLNQDIQSISNNIVALREKILTDQHNANYFLETARGVEIDAVVQQMPAVALPLQSQAPNGLFYHQQLGSLPTATVVEALVL